MKELVPTGEPEAVLYVGVDSQSREVAREVATVLLDAGIDFATIPFETRTRPALFFHGGEFYGLDEIREAMAENISADSSLRSE